jgi:hypothetical protein
VSLRALTRTAVEERRLDQLDDLVKREPRAVRYLVALTYQPDAAVRETACRGIGFAARYHTRLVQKVIRRLVWAMNDESGTHAVTAPAVLLAIAEERPELLLPMVPDLIRLTADEGLQEGLADTLRTVAERCPGEVGSAIGESLRDRLRGRKRHDPLDARQTR